MMIVCSTGELLTSAAFMHHDDQGHDALGHSAVLKGLRHMVCLDKLMLNLGETIFMPICIVSPGFDHNPLRRAQSINASYCWSS